MKFLAQLFTPILLGFACGALVRLFEYLLDWGL